MLFKCKWMTAWLRHAPLWTWLRVANTLLYSQWALLQTLADCPWNTFVWLGLSPVRMSSFPRRLPSLSCTRTLADPSQGPSRLAPGPVFILEWRWPGLEPGLSCINESWNVKCRCFWLGGSRKALGRGLESGPAAGASHRVPRSMMLWEMMKGSLFGDSPGLYSRGQEKQMDLSFRKCHSEGWLEGREAGKLLRKLCW